MSDEEDSFDSRSCHCKFRVVFGGIVPAKVEWAVLEAGLLLYGAQIIPTKVGPVLYLAANYPHNKLQVDPLTDEESHNLKRSIKTSLSESGYRSKIRSFVFLGEPDPNDFRLKVLLKEKDLESVQYDLIRKLRSQKVLDDVHGAPVDSLAKSL